MGIDRCEVVRVEPLPAHPVGGTVQYTVEVTASIPFGGTFKDQIRVNVNQNGVFPDKTDLNAFPMQLRVGVREAVRARVANRASGSD